MEQEQDQEQQQEQQQQEQPPPLLLYVVLYNPVKTESGKLQVQLAHCFAAHAATVDEDRRVPPARFARLCYPDLDRLPQSGAADAGVATLLVEPEDGRGRTLFGFAQRLAARDGLPATLCIVTPHPWFAFWRTVVGWAHARLQEAPSSSEAWAAVAELAQALVCSAVPRPGESLRVYTDYAYCHNIAEAVRRPHDALRPSGETLAPLLTAAAPTKVVLAATALLTEHSVVVVARALPVLTQSVAALALLLWPFVWPHHFASVCCCSSLSTLVVITLSVHRLCRVMNAKICLPLVAAAAMRKRRRRSLLGCLKTLL